MSPKNACFLQCVETKKGLYRSKVLFFVIRMGFEPMTPTLKVLCSTS